jgi:predicted HD superfamily hydrolase involved in NAD metabolism
MLAKGNAPMLERYTPEFEAQVRAWSEQRIPPKRRPHVEGVVAMVDKLARLYAPDEVMRVRLAGWIHDAAKALSDAELLELAQAYRWQITPIEYQTPMLLHGAVGYLLANDTFHLHDERLQTACAYHTTGAVDMNLTDKIVFLGDAIEEATRDYPGVEELRQLALTDLDAAILRYVDNTLAYLIERQQTIDPRVVELRNQLLNHHKVARDAQ